MFRIFNRVKPYMDLNSEDFEREIKNSDQPVILDVRTPGEYNLGKIPNAINIDITRGDFESLIAGFGKEKTYFVYCRGGNRSVAACTILGSKGFRSYNLVDGIHTWKGEMEGTV